MRSPIGTARLASSVGVESVDGAGGGVEVIEAQVGGALRRVLDADAAERDRHDADRVPHGACQRASGTCFEHFDAARLVEIEPLAQHRHRVLAEPRPAAADEPGVFVIR